MRKFTPKFILTALLFLTVTLKAQIFTNGSFELWPNGCPVNTAPNNRQTFPPVLDPTKQERVQVLLFPIRVHRT